MKAVGRSFVLSARQWRAQFAGVRVLSLSNSPFLVARRKARQRGKNSSYRLPNQRRAYQCLNVCGVRIWADKPRQFKGMKWRARCATVARFVALCEFREFRAWQREGLAPFAAGRANHSLCVDLEACAGGGWVSAVLSCYGSCLSFTGGPIDAPEWIAAGYMSAAYGGDQGVAVRRDRWL